MYVILFLVFSHVRVSKRSSFQTFKFPNEAHHAHEFSVVDLQGRGMNLGIKYVLIVVLLLNLLSEVGKATLSKKDKKKRKEHDKNDDKKASCFISIHGDQFHTWSTHRYIHTNRFISLRRIISLQRLPPSIFLRKLSLKEVLFLSRWSGRRLWAAINSTLQLIRPHEDWVMTHLHWVMSPPWVGRVQIVHKFAVQMHLHIVHFGDYLCWKFVFWPIRCNERKTNNFCVMIVCTVYSMYYIPTNFWGTSKVFFLQIMAVKGFS